MKDIVQKKENPQEKCCTNMRLILINFAKLQNVHMWGRNFRKYVSTFDRAITKKDCEKDEYLAGNLILWNDT